MPITVTTAVSIELTMLNCKPDHTNTARVNTIESCTTTIGSTIQRSDRKQTMITRAKSSVEVRPNRLPSSST